MIRALFVPFFLTLFCFALAGKETLLTFDGAPHPNPKYGGITVDWVQNKTKSLAPYGKAEIIDLTMGKVKKCLKITGSTKKVDVFSSRTFPATVDSRFKISAVFTGPGTLRVGFYGYNAKGGMCEYQLLPMKTFAKGWDSRSTIFTVRKPETVKIRLLLSVAPGESMTFSRITYTRLSDAEKYLLPSHNLRLWHERTKGFNLARNKKLSFDPMPNYAPTARGGSDATDLTDGKFNGSRDQLWFDPAAVAWFNAWDGVRIIVDLGSVQNVKKAVIRICGGRLPQSNIKFPKYLEAFVSEDGKNFYRTISLNKLKESEYELSDWKSNYFLKESDDNKGTPYVYPFELALNAKARFVVIQSNFADIWVTMACDELAVIREDAPQKAPGFNSVYKTKPVELFHKELRIRPRLDTFYVADNMAAPNFLILNDRNPVKKGKITFSIDLPESIQFTNDAVSYPQPCRLMARTEKKNGRIIRHFKTVYNYDRFKSMTKSFGLGPFFFRAPAGKVIAKKDLYAEFVTYINGKKHSTTRLPLEIISIPSAGRAAKHLNTLINYRTDQALGWPEFLKTQKHLGMGNILFLMPSAARTPQAMPLYHAAKKEGFRIRHFTVPTLYIHGTYPKLPDYRCVGMPTSLYGFCPSYRGKYFQEILARITESVKKMPPDFITFEDECWQPQQMNHILDCSRCQAYRKKKGMEEKRFVQWVQADFLSHYKAAIIKGFDGKGYAPHGHYVLNPFAPGYSCRLGAIPHLGGWDLFPKYADELNMSYYGRDPLEFQKMIRKAFTHLKNPRQILPFMTAGTGSYREEPMGDVPEKLILEAIMNGAGGFEIYHYTSMESPIDYVPVANAMKQILPYEELLMKAPLVLPANSNKKVAVTGRKQGKTMLLLLGNYGAFVPAATVVTLPGNPKFIKEIKNGKKLSARGNKLAITIPANGYRFLEIGF